MVKAKCGGMLIDGSTLKMVNGIITLADGNPTSAVVANCGGVLFDATYFKKIDNVITIKEATDVEPMVVVQKGCGGLLVDGNYFNLDNDVLAYEAPYVPSAECDITAFDIGEAKGVISGTNIVVEVPKGTDVTKLTPTITISSGAVVSPKSGIEQDFTNAVTYTVVAENETTTKIYTVTVTVAEA